MRKIAVLTSGGDAPGMNSAVRAVVYSAIHEGMEITGIIRGWEGLIDWDAVNLTIEDVRNINNVGGTILYTSRSERFMEKKYREIAAQNLLDHGIDSLVAIGGEGTMKGAIELSKEGINVVLIPGTIDRDISCTEYTIGFDTAANTAMTAIDSIRDSSIAHGRCSVVEVMGRKRGYIALWAGMAASADTILLPEKWDGDYDSIMQGIKRRLKTDEIDKLRGLHRGRASYLIVVAEGVTDANALADRIKEETGVESRVSVLGYLQRGGAPTSKDRMYASLMGAFAVECCKQEKKNRIIAIKNDVLIDYDLTEALTINNNELDDFQWELSQWLEEY